jgi:cytosine/adenosine deaminase-related metal-dependent hydrolase
VYREVLDAFDPRRTPAAIARVEAPWPKRRGCRPAWSPHAPHTTSDALLRAVGRRARETRGWIGVHWAETAEEGEWLERDRGPFRALCGPSPRASGLARLEAHGLLGPRTALYHGNAARAAELDRVARAGATLVHCPGTHLHFGRAPVDLARWRARGVRVALGTDSLASNADLDLARELVLLERTAPGLAPADAWELATRAGARALGAEGRAGEIRAGTWADFAAWELADGDARATLAALTRGGARLAATWLAGERVGGGSGTAAGPVW